MSLPAALATNPSADPVRTHGLPREAPGEDVSLGGCFGVFLRRLVPAPTAYGDARAVGTEVALSLRAELTPRAGFDFVDHVVTGSVGKRTAIAPIASVDVLYALPPKLLSPRAADALKIVQAVLHHRYGAATTAPDDSGVMVMRGAHTVKVWPARLHLSVTSRIRR